MIVWIDAQLPPSIAPWIEQSFGITVRCVRDLGLREAKDPDIFQAARAARAVAMTKDSDFVELVGRRGTPPQVLWVTCGNTSNAHLRVILAQRLSGAISELKRGQAVVEIGDVKAEDVRV